MPECSNMLQGKRVLDVCSYVGAWGVQAATAGASDVFCVDSSSAALDRVELNAQLNGVTEQVAVLHGDAFDAMRELRSEQEKFDVVVVDPPAFIKRRKDLREGTLAYRRLNLAAMQLLVERWHSDHILLLPSHGHPKLVANGTESGSASGSESTAAGAGLSVTGPPDPPGDSGNRLSQDVLSACSADLLGETNGRESLRLPVLSSRFPPTLRRRREFRQPDSGFPAEFSTCGVRAACSRLRRDSWHHRAGMTPTLHRTSARRD